MLSLSAIPKGRARSRARSWWNLLTVASSKAESSAFVPAGQLYKGNYWSIVQQLSTEAKRHGFEPHLWVISAGYGLISDLDLLLPYSATFTKGDIDGITTGTKELDASEQWWNEVSRFNLPDSDNPRSLSELLRVYRKDRFLVVVSSDYMSAIQSDLISGLRGLGDQPNLVLISSKNEFIARELKPHYIATDARLVCDPNCPIECDLHLLGRSVRGLIGVVLARQLLKKVDNWGFSPGSVRTNVESFLANSPKLFTHKRLSVKDDIVKEFIGSELKLAPDASSTRLLRKYRDRGFACEQKRFKCLFQQVKEIGHES